jgi:hypothetical protein
MRLDRATMVLVTVAACVRAPAPTAIQPAPHPATRPDADCAQEVAQSIADPELPGLFRPVPRTELGPPLQDVPRDLRNRQLLVRLYVDLDGRTEPDSIKMPISENRLFNARYRRQLTQAAFWPATYQGCRVPAWYELRMVLFPQPDTTPGRLGRVPARRAPSRPDSECSAEVAEAARGDTVVGLIPPTIDSLVLPPTPLPSELRGRTLTARLFVDRHGRVVPDSTRLEPPPRDRGFAGEFRARLARYRLEPAMLRGCAVPSWFKMRVTF